MLPSIARISSSSRIKSFFLFSLFRFLVLGLEAPPLVTNFWINEVVFCNHYFVTRLLLIDLPSRFNMNERIVKFLSPWATSDLPNHSFELRRVNSAADLRIHVIVWFYPLGSICSLKVKSSLVAPEALELGCRVESRWFVARLILKIF